MARELKGESVTIVGGLATNADICKLFNLTNKTVQKKLATLNPVLVKGVAKYYNLEEVLPLIVKPKNIGDYIRTMHFTELPKELSKEYWAGQRTKQLFERDAGILWSTNEVISKVGDAFKTVAMQLRLIADNVHRVAELTPQQRAEIEHLVDGAMQSIHTELAEKFKPVDDIAPPPEETATGDEHDADDIEGEDDEL